MKPLIETHRQWPYKRSYDLGGGVQLDLGTRTLIMGILNTTPDSFSDGGRYSNIKAAVAHACEMAEAGADIIDIGGESTRPDSDPVTLEEELRRVVPTVEAVRKALPNMPLSIDTYKAETARQALEAGAHIINDVWGFKADPRMAEVAAEYGCPVILSHNRHGRDYNELVPDVIADLQESMKIARQSGVRDDSIWLDPGIGFAKDYDENLVMMGGLSRLSEIGFPVLLGTSRKLFIRQTLTLSADEVVFGTAATVTLGIAQGCQIIRVHDVRDMKRTAMMADAVIYRKFT
ncbi:dihydropteroate synthase [Paenibacillus baekrokdamisoli]